MDIFEYDMTDVEDRYLNNREHKKNIKGVDKASLGLKSQKKNYFVLLTLQYGRKYMHDIMKLITITTQNNKLYKEYAHRFESTYNWSWYLYSL